MSVTVNGKIDKKYGYQRRYSNLKEIPPAGKKWVIEQHNDELNHGTVRYTENGMPIVRLDTWSLHNLISDGYITKFKESTQGETVWKTSTELWDYLINKEQDDERFELAYSNSY